mmetsp:Transcript_48449/g.138487  ORF Transcript_48449/g.138487 Transcript_48449/m.138487 type:complete len:288 (-) Transcript_48449:94-957(-)
MVAASPEKKARVAEAAAATTSIEHKLGASGELSRNAISCYDEKMAELYKDVSESLPHKYVMGHTLKKAMGDVKGQTVLEAACGNGAYMSYLHEQGASLVVGLDLSAENLGVCQRAHREQSIMASAMRYVQADLGVPGEYSGGPFDLAVMGCCICYCSSHEMLASWMKNMHSNLKPGGRVVIVNTRGAVKKAGQEELVERFKIEYSTENEEGNKSFDPVWVVFPNGWTAKHYYYLEPKHVCEAMVQAGFQVEQRPMLSDPEYDGKEDVPRLLQLMPYDCFVGTRPSLS